MTQSSQVKSRRWLTAGCALIVGVALGVGGSMAFGGDGEAGVAADTGATVTLPDTLDGLRPEAEVVAEVITSDNPASQEAAELREKVRDEVLAKLSSAYGDAATGRASYADDGLEVRVDLYVVAASSPALWSSQDAESAPELLNLATPMEWVEADGNAQCLVRTINPSMAGTDPADTESFAQRCQAVQEGVTVILESHGTELTAERGLELVQQAADEVAVG